MSSFENFNLGRQLQKAIDDLGFSEPTPIQEKAYSVILSGKDVVGIAQTGTGKTFAYMLPLLHQLKFSKEIPPRILILVPTRELVMQVVENISSYAKYMNVRVLGVYGEANIRLQKEAILNGWDILVATPGRLYDLVHSGALSFKGIKKLVIDEVDVMLDLGFRSQLEKLFDLLPEKRQNIMFSATMTSEVEELINDIFASPEKISVAISGTRLDTIDQVAFPVKNFYTKANLLSHLLRDKKEFKKVLVFVSNKKIADRLFECLEESFLSSMAIIHSNKSQNYRIRSVEDFESGTKRILIATDIISRGLDFSKVSHVISFDTPSFPENYIHRIGRTGRASSEGKSILFYTPSEETLKMEIEKLMAYDIPTQEFPDEVRINDELIPEERPQVKGKNYLPPSKKRTSGPAFHEKLEKNKKVNEGGSYKKKLAGKYKKPKTRGQKRK